MNWKALDARLATILNILACAVFVTAALVVTMKMYVDHQERGCVCTGEP